MSAIAQRRTAVAAAIMMLFAVLQFALFTVNPDPAGAAHVTPILVDQTSNLTCNSLAGDGQTWTEVKVDPNADGVYGDGTLSVTISNTTDDKSFDWSSNIGVDAVYVKAGSGGSYLYRYDPPAEATSDTGLTTPGDGTSNAISHISFCYDTEEPDFELPPREDGSCPIPDIDAIAAEFDGKVYASGGGPSEVGPVPIDLPAGVYDVYLTSRDTNHAEEYDPQPFEVFFVRGFFEGSAVWDSPEISDLPDDDVKMTELVASGVSIPQLDELTAIHPYYPSDFSDSIEPICIVFVPQDTPPEEPTPVSVVVSGTCEDGQEDFVARVSVDSITPDGDVVVMIGGVTVAEGATADLALDTDLSVVATSPSGDFDPTTNVDSLNISSEGCDDTPDEPDEPTNPTRRTRTTTPPLGAIGDLVWFDENQNGQQDNPAVEFPINGATVTLLASDGTVLAQQVTSTDGLYLFDELEAGNYRVEACVGGSEYTTTDALGVADDVDSDVFPLSDKNGCARTGLISLPEGVTDLTWDAGILIEVEGIQVEPTTTTAPAPTTTVEPVTVGTLPFTGFEVEDVVFLSLGALAAGSVLLLAVSRREDEGVADEVLSGWSNT